jgi:DNA repair exonuclease SbcCD nuclease subunit
MKIYHAADIHLGRRRLDGRLPDSDIAAAFEYIAKAAIDDQADVLLLAGDLFDRPQVEPPHLRQAQRILSLLNAARIPVIAIEGNHDKAFVSSLAPTWLDYLAQEDLLRVLKPTFDASGALLSAWDDGAKRGSYINIDGVRFVGAGYLGAATPHKIRQIVEKLEPEHSHVLLLHAGPDYFVGEGGGFSTDDLRAIRERVRYLALGHIHKPMTYGGWACNPGSPENCDLREAYFDRDAAGAAVSRGYAVVELDPRNSASPVSIAVRSNPRRPCIQLELDCTPFGNKLKDGAAALEKAALKLIKAGKPPAGAVVELRLTGRINLDRIALDLEGLSVGIEAAAGVATVCINPIGINLNAIAIGASANGEILSREEIERTALSQLVDKDHLWGLDGEQQTAATLFYELKEAIRQGRSTEETAEIIRTTPLLEKVRLANATPAPIGPEIIKP